ncbi:MAG: hypothetical protein ACI8PB_001752 [Desulforhopalus sp.]|jgi:hypothetical protein
MMRKNENDTLTGLLGLSADKNNKMGPCVSDEELAMLVEDNMDREYRQKCMEHLAHCETCYNQWLFLKNAEDNHKKNIFDLLSKKSYKYIGSSLALAASVVVFLNVYSPSLVEVIPVPENAVILDEKSSDRIDSESGLSEERERDEIQVEEQVEMPPTPLIKMQKNTTHGKAERKEAKKESLKPVMQKQFFESAVPVAKSSARTRVVVTSTSLTKDEFYSMIAEGCQKEKFDQKYWSDLSVEGTKLFTTQSPDTMVYRHLIELLDGMEQETWQQRCDEISHLLAEEIKSR